MAGLKISLLLLATSCILTRTKTEEIADPLDFYEKQLCEYYDTYEEIKEYECGKLNLKEVNKLIKEGDKKVEFQANNQNVLVLIGKAHSDKTLFGNIIGRQPLDKVPEADIDTYPRYISKIEGTSALVYEAADLNSTTINKHIAGIYLLNKVLESAKGISFVFTKRRLDIWAVWRYFKKIAMFNPDLGLSGLKNSEAVITTGLEHKDVFSREAFDPKITFGNKGFILFKKEIFEEQELYDEFQKYDLPRFLNSAEFASKAKLPLFNGYECLNKTLNEKIIKVLSEAASKMTKKYTKIAFDSSMSKSDRLKKFDSTIKSLKQIETALESTKEEIGLKESLKEIELITDKNKIQDIEECSKYLFLLGKDVGYEAGIKPLTKYLQSIKSGLQ